MKANLLIRFSAAIAAMIPALNSSAFLVQSELFTASGPSEPMFLTAPVGDSNHVYIGARKNAAIRVYDRDNGNQVSLFLNLPDGSVASQDGLLNMAFHPDYATNGLFYTYVYRNSEQMLRITEHRRSVDNPLVADPSYSRQIYEMPNNNSHNGGWLGFSPIDGYLYFTTGDGGANQGPNNGLPAQDLFDPHGKLHRVDVSGDDFPNDPAMNFAVPADNPFAQGGGLPEVYAYGLRHPFRASFDRLTGDLFIGDVGGIQYEEINRVPAGVGGLNFGWRPLEGPDKTIENDDPIPPNTVAPYHYYPHDQTVSVIGGHVYRGSEYPDLQGTYFHADFYKANVESFDVSGASPTSITDRTNELFGPNGLNGIVAFGEDGLGELYVVHYLQSDIYRIKQLIVTPVDGDYNGDGLVDIEDYTVWRDNVGMPAGTLPNDPNTSDIGPDQYQTWVDQFGASGIVNAAVPEPLSLCLLTIGVAASAVRRR